MDPKILKALALEEYEHYQYVKGERGTYYIRKKKSIDYPEESMSIIIDGADWQRFGVPHFAERTHGSEKIKRIPYYVMGCINHGRGAKCFIVPGYFTQGTNVVVQIIISTLNAQLAKEGFLPKYLYLQLDNTVKQNKNKFLMGFLGLLIINGVFENIYVSFLPVGHTHEDIDQLFSRLAVALASRDCHSLLELCDVIRSAFHDSANRRCEAELMTSVSNFSDWVDVYLNKFEGITRSMQMSIKLIGLTPCVRVRERTTGTGNWAGIDPEDQHTAIFAHHPPSPFTLPDCQVRPLDDKTRKTYSNCEGLVVRQQTNSVCLMLPNQLSHIYILRNSTKVY
jgi:hypothetical protein